MLKLFFNINLWHENDKSEMQFAMITKSKCFCTKKANNIDYLLVKVVTNSFVSAVDFCLIQRQPNKRRAGIILDQQIVYTSLY